MKQKKQSIPKGQQWFMDIMQELGYNLKNPGNPNYFGIQFHPEYLKEEKEPEEYQRQLRILQAFKKSCIQFHNAKKMKKDICIDNTLKFFAKKDNIKKEQIVDAQENHFIK